LFSLFLCALSVSVLLLLDVLIVYFIFRDDAVVRVTVIGDRSVRLVFWYAHSLDRLIFLLLGGGGMRMGSR